MAVLDSPGFNDPDKERSDTETFIDMVNCLNDSNLIGDGISTLLQCVMVPESGRIKASAIELMSNML